MKLFLASPYLFICVLVHVYAYNFDRISFNMDFAGAPQTEFFYRKMSFAYPSRPGIGTQVASISYFPVGNTEGFNLLSQDKVLAVCSLSSLPSNMTGLISLPLTTGALVFIYNGESFPGMSEGQRLVLPYDVPGRIYSGEITTWNHPAIQAANPNYTLPNATITVVTSADRNGDVYPLVRRIFYLVNNTWPAIEKSDPWPKADMEAGNEDKVIASVLLTKYSFGFAVYEKAISTNSTFALIKNYNGDIVGPNSASKNAALNSFIDDLTYEPNYIYGDLVNSKAPNAYPYVYFFSAVLPANPKGKCRERRETLRWAYWRLTDPGAKVLAETEGFDPLPKVLSDKNTEIAKTIICDDKVLYGESPCDTGCFRGSCDVIGLFHAPEDICECDIGYANIEKKDCSEIPLSDKDIQGATTESLVGVQFSVPFAGVRDISSLYQQLSLSYPVRPDRGTLTATVSFSGIGSVNAIESVEKNENQVAIAFSTIPSNMTDYIAFPVVAGTQVIVYNRNSFPSLRGNQQIVLPLDVIISIFLGEITMWTDEKIRDANPGVFLPNKKINVVVPIDIQGGSTASMREAFATIDRRWNATTPDDPWPYYTIKAGNQVEALSQVIVTPYSIGFAAFSQAVSTSTAFAAIKNVNGELVNPSVETITNAINYYLDANLITQTENFIGGSIVNANTTNSYPFAFFYYAVIKRDFAGMCRERREALRFLHWQLTDERTRYIVENSGYKPLPNKWVDLIVEITKKVKCDGKEVFGASPCDTGCVGGKCNVVGLFNPPEDVCQCTVDFINDKKNDCSESRPAEFVSFTDTTGATIAALSAIFAVYSLFVMGLIFHFRNLPFVKALSPIFCILTLAGLFLEYVGVFVLIGKPSNASCSLQMWFLSLPLAVIFAAIIVKQYRLVTVFENKARVSIGIKNNNLLMLIGLIITPCVILLVLYSVVVQPSALRVMSSANEYVWKCSPKNKMAEDVVFALLGSYHLLQICFSLYLRIKGRNVRDEFNETRAVGLVVYILTTVALITVIILSIPQLPSRARFLIRSAAILLSSFSFTVVLFLKPLKNIRSHKDNLTKNSKESADNSVRIVKKNGVMISESINDSASGVSSHSSGSESELDLGPVMKIKEDAWKWNVFARPQKFLESWRQCNLTFHKELGTISIVQRHGLKDKTTQPLSVCFPTKVVKLIYRGYNVVGGKGSENAGAKILKAFNADRTAEELEGLVLEFSLPHGETYSVQMKSIKQAEQVVGLFTGTYLSDDTKSQASSRHRTPRSQPEIAKTSAVNSKPISSRNDEKEKMGHSKSNHESKSQHESDSDSDNNGEEDSRGLVKSKGDDKSEEQSRSQLKSKGDDHSKSQMKSKGFTKSDVSQAEDDDV